MSDDSDSGPVQRALSIKEVLSEIFLYSTRGDNTSNARVCKTWSCPAFSVVWSNMTIRNLVELLAPLEVDTLGKTSFSRAILASDWTRFDNYAWRVHVLTFGCCDYSESVFSQIAYTRRRFILLPNLIKLELSGSIPAASLSLFGHASLETLNMESSMMTALLENEVSQAQAAAMLSYIPTQIPNLRTICIRSYKSQFAKFLQPALAPALRDLHLLKFVELPTSQMTDQIFLALSTLSNLHTLRMCTSTMPCPATFPPPFPHGCFPSLKSLIISTTLSQATLWLSQANFPKRLTRLSFLPYPRAPNLSAQACQDFVQMIASNYTSLYALSLSPILKASMPLFFDVLEPVLSLSSLWTLKVTDHPTLQLKEDNLVKIFNALPNLKILSFQHRADTSKLPLTTLTALSPISPNLEELALHLNTSLHIDAPALVVLFLKLRILDVGQSPIVAPVEVAMFLSRVLPEGCTLKFKPEHLGDASDSAWKTVHDLLPAFARVRKEERTLTLASMQSA